MSLKDDARAADAALRKAIKDGEQLGHLTTISKYNSELKSNLQLARVDVERLTGEVSACKSARIAAEAKVEGLETQLVSLRQQLAGQQRREAEWKPRANTDASAGELYEIAKSPHGSIKQAQLEVLIPGPKIGSGPVTGWRDRREQLIRVIERDYPDLCRALAQVDVLTVHQDSYAAGYHADEYALLGMTVKYAGLQGKTVLINGQNGETFDEPIPPETDATRADQRPWYRRLFR